jgi:hypothetical protein
MERNKNNSKIKIAGLLLLSVAFYMQILAQTGDTISKITDNNNVFTQSVIDSVTPRIDIKKEIQSIDNPIDSPDFDFESKYIRKRDTIFCYIVYQNNNKDTFYYSHYLSKISRTKWKSNTFYDMYYICRFRKKNNSKCVKSNNERKKKEDFEYIPKGLIYSFWGNGHSIYYQLGSILYRKEILSNEEKIIQIRGEGLAYYKHEYPNGDKTIRFLMGGFAIYKNPTPSKKKQSFRVKFVF